MLKTLCAVWKARDAPIRAYLHIVVITQNWPGGWCGAQDGRTCSVMRGSLDLPEKMRVALASLPDKSLGRPRPSVACVPEVPFISLPITPTLLSIEKSCVSEPSGKS